VEVYGVICAYATENPGATPTSDEIAACIDVSPRYVRAILEKLEYRGKIVRLSKQRYKVPDLLVVPPQE
jgi:predicted transcriptional regulator of viral defense system